MSETFNNSEGRRVVAFDNAEDVGEVKGFVVDRSATRVESLHVGGRGRRADVVPWSHVRSFGPDAVVIDAADAVARVDGDLETDAVKGNVVVRSSRVLRTDGTEAGSVEDVMFDVESGELTGALTTEGHIHASVFRSIGSYALVIDARGA